MKREIFYSIIVCLFFCTTVSAANNINEYLPTEKDEQISRNIKDIASRSLNLRRQIHTFYDQTTNPRFKYLLAPAVYNQPRKIISFIGLMNLIQGNETSQYICERYMAEGDGDEEGAGFGDTTTTINDPQIKIYRIFEDIDSKKIFEEKGYVCNGFGGYPNSLFTEVASLSEGLLSVPFSNMELINLSIYQQDAVPNLQETEEEKVAGKSYKEKISIFIHMLAKNKLFGFELNNTFQSPAVRSQYEIYWNQCGGNNLGDQPYRTPNQCVSDLLSKDPLVRRIIQREYYNALDTRRIR